MENNVEFRIWDNKENKWIEIASGVILNHKPYCTSNYFLDHLGRVCWPSDEAGPIMCMGEEGRYEVSQYIGRKDSAGVKAFTGDMGEFRTGPAEITTGCIVSDEGYKVDLLGKGITEIGDMSFVISGNRWEGLHAAEVKAPIEPVCDSTVQKQNKDAQDIEDIKKMFKNGAMYLNPPSAIFTSTGSEYRKVDKESSRKQKEGMEAFKEVRDYYLHTQPAGRDSFWPTQARALAKNFDPIFGAIKIAASEGKMKVMIPEGVIDEAIKFALTSMGYKLDLYKPLLASFRNEWIISWEE